MSPLMVQLFKLQIDGYIDAEENLVSPPSFLGRPTFTNSLSTSLHYRRAAPIFHTLLHLVLTGDSLRQTTNYATQSLPLSLRRRSKTSTTRPSTRPTFVLSLLRWRPLPIPVFFSSTRDTLSHPHQFAGNLVCTPPSSFFSQLFTPTHPPQSHFAGIFRRYVLEPVMMRDFFVSFRPICRSKL